MSICFPLEDLWRAGLIWSGQEIWTSRIKTKGFNSKMLLLKFVLLYFCDVFYRQSQDNQFNSQYLGQLG